MSKDKISDAILNAASQATATNEFGTMRDAAISSFGSKSQMAMNIAQGIIFNTAPTVAASAISPEAAGLTALATVISKAAKGKIGWSI